MILHERGKLSDEQKRRIARLLMARSLPTSVAGVSVRRIPPETWEEALVAAELLAQSTVVVNY